MGDFELSTHNTKLQSLRGLAALSVAVGHTAICVPNALIETVPVTLTNFPLLVLRLLFQANSAVVFFFVLSGLVLGASLQRSANEPFIGRISSFAVRRLFRLMPIVIVSLLFASALFKSIEGYSIPPMATWFNGYFRVPVNWSGLLRNMMFAENSINGVLWSIWVEVAMILWLPLLSILAARTQPTADLAIVAILWFVPWMFLPPGNGQGIMFYVFCFYTGMCVHKLGNTRVALLLNRGDLLIFGLALMIGFEALWLLSAQRWTGYKYLIDTIVSAQILIFVMLRPDFSILRFLDSWSLRTLGDISYSFYAFGLAITVGIFFLISRVVNLPVVFTDAYATILVGVVATISILTTFFFSLATYRWIEMPSIAIGRRCAAFFTGPQ
jgi:peptidoglycan/LPS O-acetylase OafA/YrhL